MYFIILLDSIKDQYYGYNTLTLFTLLIVMALERIVTKTKTWHVTTIAQHYFAKISSFTNKDNGNKEKNIETDICIMLVIAGIPAVAIMIIIDYLPGLLVFVSYLLLLWICLGCPVTRKTYKKYLQAANREDFQACSLYSEKFGNEGGDLSKVGKQLILINYRHYASVIIFFVFFGLPGMVFYSLCKEWYLAKKNQPESNSQPEIDELPANDSDVLEPQNQLKNEAGEEKLMFVLDWLPSRITAFGFLLVGHFSKGLPVWLDTFANPKISAVEVLASVAKSSEEIAPCENPHLQEPLHMVKLAKRNVIFLLMAISVMTLVGLVG